MKSCRTAGWFVAITALLLASAARAATESPPMWSRPYVTTAAIYNALNGFGAAIAGIPHPRWTRGIEIVGNRFGVNYTARLHFVPNLRRGLTRHQFLFGLGGDFGVTPAVAAGGSATWVAPAVDLRYLGRPHPAFGFILGTRLGVGFAWEARALTSARLPSPPRDHLALVCAMYFGLAFGHHAVLP